jgi:pimeloyl-ACP methyl ester carboxylesterase
MEERVISDVPEHDYINVNKIRIHYATSGSGEPILLLHGFPEFWYSWRHQIPVLSKRFKVIAPDLRGYNESEKPTGLRSYSYNILVQDIKEMIAAQGVKSASVVGHDWGGAIAWYLAMMAPEYVKRLVILNCPHPIALVESYLSMMMRQLQKSWYIFFFQLPDIPEKVLSQNNCEFLRKMLVGSAVNKGTFTEEDLQRYVEAWSKPGALTASINYYRANMNIAQILALPREQQESMVRRYQKVKCPTLVIWGEDDAALDKSLTIGMNKYVEGHYEIKYIPKCGHWVQQEKADEVNKLLLEFLSGR